VSTTVEANITIRRRPEAVTRVILDPTRTVLWTSDLERFEVVSGEPGLVGSVALLHYRRGNRRYVMEDTLLEAEPNRRYVSRVHGQGLSAQVETLLTQEGGDGTLVTVRWTGRGTQLLMRLLLPFMRRAVARGALRDLTSLKRLVEQTE
jgi:hypothetical protein